MKLTAIGNQVIVALAPREDVSKGGIHIPQRAQEPSTEATVLSVGGLVEGIKAGDVVGVPKHLGTVANIGGKEVLFIEAKKVLYVRE